jgi:putative ATP-dependent endonuclease of OLD family
MRFPEIKEAFYAKCVILIEGATEYGCINAFAEKIGVSLDDNGICIINSQGAGSVKPLQKLLKLFDIPSFAIYDGDVKPEQTHSDTDFYTTEPCFEQEIVKKLFATGQAYLVREIVSEIDAQADSVELDKNLVEKYFRKMKLDPGRYNPKKLKDVSDKDEVDFCTMFSAWFMSKKGVILGRTIGELIPKECIPPCYKNAILKAQEKASHV